METQRSFEEGRVRGVVERARVGGNWQFGITLRGCCSTVVQMPLDSLTIFSFRHVTEAHPFHRAEFRPNPQICDHFLSVRRHSVISSTTSRLLRIWVRPPRGSSQNASSSSYKARECSQGRSLNVHVYIFLSDMRPLANMSSTPSERKNLSRLSSPRLLLRFCTNMLHPRDPGIVPSPPSSL